MTDDATIRRNGKYLGRFNRHRHTNGADVDWLPDPAGSHHAYEHRLTVYMYPTESSP